MNRWVLVGGIVLGAALLIWALMLPQRPLPGAGGTPPLHETLAKQPAAATPATAAPAAAPGR